MNNHGPSYKGVNRREVVQICSIFFYLWLLGVYTRRTSGKEYESMQLRQKVADTVAKHNEWMDESGGGDTAVQTSFMGRMVSGVLSCIGCGPREHKATVVE